MNTKLETLLTLVRTVRSAECTESGFTQIKEMLVNQTLVWPHFGIRSLFTDCQWISENPWSRRVSVSVRKKDGNERFWLDACNLSPLRWVKFEETENAYVLSFSWTVAQKALIRELVKGFKLQQEIDRLHRRLRMHGSVPYAYQWDSYELSHSYASDAIRRRGITGMRGDVAKILAAAWPEKQVSWASDSKLKEEGNDILAGHGGFTVVY